ncbi:predicted protein [Botrytis cinerea T4]|uniref:Uncharacterized protein n=1 Tax=Botryotinia fuckeliana (strain T4) TaxID=999810 RepID=G2YG47_BOTF4|nr:predicted protein [Botrytis cinerea T4]
MGLFGSVNDNRYFEHTTIQFKELGLSSNLQEKTSWSVKLK